MHTKMIVAGSLLAIGLLGSGAAQAQNASSSLSGTVGAMTCSDYTRLSADAQASLLTQTDQSNSSSSLTSNSGVAANSDKSSNSGAAAIPLNSGQLIAACQAASPSSTVQDAYSHFNSAPATTNHGSGQ